jgi:hypothetical protein
MAEEEFTGMYELLDALEAALKTADPAKRQALAKTSRAFPKFESYGMLETAASVRWKVKDAIVGFHGIGRLVTPIIGPSGHTRRRSCTICLCQ